MQIYGPTNLHGTQKLGAPHGNFRSQPSPPSGGAIRDELELSDEARRLADAADAQPVSNAQSGEIRQDRVDAIRAQIESGTYETPEKLDIALSRFLDTLG